MTKCSVCNTIQQEIGRSTISLLGDSFEVVHYNINLITHTKGKWICDDCMDIYRKIYAMEMNQDFSCLGKRYYADGRNLDSK